MEKELKKKLPKRDRARHGHDCWDWGGMWIDELDPEFSECTCFADCRRDCVNEGSD
jgi:hypothetical protein